MKICSGRGITIGITGLQENIGRDDLIEELYWDTPIYTNETINFQIWPSAIVGAGSFWNYQSKLTPDSKEFAMVIDTQHKMSRYVRFLLTLQLPEKLGKANESRRKKLTVHALTWLFASGSKTSLIE